MQVLGLFAKEPRPGQVKTRLAVATSADWAARVAAAFLHDLLDRLAWVDVRRVLAFAPPDAEPYFAGLAGGRFMLASQGPGDLGQRLSSFFTRQFNDGATAVVVLGTDSPTLPLEYVRQAFDELERNDVVLGPACDGGYYLLGCRRLPPLFEGIPWSTARVLAETVARIRDAAWRLALLPPWYDIDTPDDWWLLRGHLAALRKAGIDPQLPRTEQMTLAEWSVEEP